MAKTLTITLYMSELMYDFQNKAFLAGRSRRADGKDAEFSSNIQASDDDEDKNQALRSIQTAYGQLLVELSEGLYGKTESAASNKLQEDSNITVTLSVPSNFTLGIKDAVCTSMHDYIVNKALLDWFLITNKDDAKEYGDLAAAALQNIHNTFNRRERPTRKSVD